MFGDVLFLVAIACPIIVFIISFFYFHKTISWKEMIGGIIIMSLLTTGIWAIGRYSNATDIEIWNGEVIAKDAIQRNCPIGWRSSKDSFCTEYRTRTVKVGETCSTDSKGNRSCTPIYDTEYKYKFPWERRYFVNTNIQYDYEISRVDDQGVRYPPLFSETSVGDPASRQNNYMNWLRAASDNIFFEDGEVEEKYKDIIPAYPDNIYDYRKINRVVTVGSVNVPNYVNLQISELLKTLGPKKQMNLILVVVDTNKVGDDFPYAVRKAWYGFKKNDAVIFLGLKDNKLVWTNVMSWSKASIFDVTVRNSIIDQYLNKEVNYSKLIDSLNIQGMLYERRSMKEFEYLKNEIPVPLSLIIFTIIFGIGGTAGLVYFFHRNDYR